MFWKEHRYIACIFMGMPQKCQRICCRGRALTAYYPKNNPTWTKDKLQSYGGTWITWSAWDPESRDIYGADLKR